MRRSLPALFAAVVAMPVAMPLGCTSSASTPDTSPTSVTASAGGQRLDDSRADGDGASRSKEESKASAPRAPMASTNAAPPPVTKSVRMPSPKRSPKFSEKRSKRKVSMSRDRSAGPGLMGRAAQPAKDMYVAEKEAPVDKVSTGGKFVHAGTNPFTSTAEDKLSTFAIDVDTGSYTFARRFLKVGNVPQAASVRVEEWVNAFHYDYAQPTSNVPFAVDMEAGPSPFHKDRHIVRVGIQGKTITNDERKPVHITFLVDVSGSMGGRNKLNLVKDSMTAVANRLRDDDSVAIVTYAGRTEEVLAATKGSDKSTIVNAIKNLRAGGGTNMGSGMELAYRNANKFLGDGRNARVVVMSDGDANIGRTRHKSILESVKGYVSEGVTLSTVGYGNGNYNDHMMEQLANAGNGNYSYIDGPEAIEKTFGQDLVGTLEVIAKDVKIQVEFNPDVVTRYRLIGYENRDVADKDFRNDKVDAGEIGAGHSVTALYEVEMNEDNSKGDVATVRVRYKKPRGTKAAEVKHAFTRTMVKDAFGKLNADTRMATALAVASEHLRGSEYAQGLNLDDARSLAAEATTGPFAKERRAFVTLLSHDRLNGRTARR